MATKRAGTKRAAPAGTQAPVNIATEILPRPFRGRIDISDAMRGDVRRFAEIGIPHAIIARIVGISLSTLKRRCRAELDAGVEVANARIALTLFETAMGGNTTALLWWEKTRAGRRDLSGDTAGIGGGTGSGLISPDMSARAAAERYRAELG